MILCDDPVRFGRKMKKVRKRHERGCRMKHRGQVGEDAARFRILDVFGVNSGCL